MKPNNLFIFILMIFLAFVRYNGFTTVHFTADDITQYFVNDYAPWVEGFSNHGRLGQIALFYIMQLLGVNIIRNQVIFTVITIVILALCSYILFLAYDFKTREKDNIWSKLLIAGGSFLVINNLFVIELFCYNMALFNYSIALLLVMLSVYTFGGSRAKNIQSFLFAFVSFWFYQNVAGYLIPLLLLKIHATSAYSIRQKRWHALGAIAMYAISAGINLFYAIVIHKAIFGSSPNPRVPTLSGLLMIFDNTVGVMLRLMKVYLLSFNAVWGGVTLLLIAVVGLCFVITYRKKTDDLMWTCLAVLSIVAIPMVPHLLNSDIMYLPPRSMVPAGSIAGLIVMAFGLFMTSKIYTKVINTLLIAGLLIFWTETKAAYIISSEMNITNQLDYERAKMIVAEIEKTEKTHGRKYEKINFVKDQNIALYYDRFPTYQEKITERIFESLPGLGGMKKYLYLDQHIYLPDSSASMMALHWSRIPLLKYVSGRQFKEVIIENTNTGEFAAKNDFRPFDPPIVRVEGDIINVVVF